MRLFSFVIRPSRASACAKFPREADPSPSNTIRSPCARPCFGGVLKPRMAPSCLNTQNPMAALAGSTPCTSSANANEVTSKRPRPTYWAEVATLPQFPGALLLPNGWGSTRSLYGFPHGGFKQICGTSAGGFPLYTVLCAFGKSAGHMKRFPAPNVSSDRDSAVAVSGSFRL